MPLSASQGEGHRGLDPGPSKGKELGDPSSPPSELGQQSVML